MLKKSAFYIFAVLFVFGGQFLMTSGLVTGQPPPVNQPTLTGQNPMSLIGQGPSLVYFWAEWCGICRGMQSNVTAVSHASPVMTVAERSGGGQQVSEYLAKNQLNWSVVNDPDGAIGQLYGVQAVPAMFFINSKGKIVFTSVGYTSEWGLRFRLWLASLL